MLYNPVISGKSSLHSPGGHAGGAAIVADTKGKGKGDRSVSGASAAALRKKGPLVVTRSGSVPFRAGADTP